MITLLMISIAVSQLEQVIPKDRYVLGPGDQIEVFVNSDISYSYPTIVDLNGQIDLYTYQPGGSQLGYTGLSMAFQAGSGLKLSQPSNLAKYGYLYVAGNTISRAEQKIKSELQKALSGKVESVDIRLIKTRTFLVPVLGNVLNPGVYPATPLERVSMLIYKAGGIKEAGDPSKILVHRPDSSVDTVNLYLFAFGGQLDANPFVSEGTQIFVPEMESWVFVEGAVNGSPFQKSLVISQSQSGASEIGNEKFPSISLRPSATGISIGHRVPFHNGMSVNDAINFCGGALQTADMSDIRVIRGSELLHVGLDAALEPFDTVVVPYSPRKVYVTGEVIQPGAFSFRPGLKVADYIGMAGGLTTRAKKSIFVYRRDGKRVKVNWDYEVEAGDRIFVPEKSLKWWQDYLQILAVISSVAVTWLTLNR